MKKHNTFLVLIFLGAVAGLILGSLLEPGQAKSLAFFGKLFINALKGLVVPLIMTSLIVGIAKLGGLKNLKVMGARTLTYYISTTLIAVVIGIVLVSIIQPGQGVSFEQTSSTTSSLAENNFKFTDVILGLFSPSLFESMSRHDQILSLIIFSIIFGALLGKLGEKGKTLVSSLDSVLQILMQMVMLVMYLAPIGIMGLIAGQLGEAGGLKNFSQEVSALGKYVLTVVLALAIHAIIIMPILVKFFAKRNPLSFARKCSVPLLSALSTASSSATLPLTFEALEKECGISNETSSFVLPLGATINMDGTALYEAVAAIFIAQVVGIDLSLSQLFLVSITATLAAIGAAGIPNAGTITLIMVLNTLDLPVEKGLALIIVVDWFLDRCRTMVNVWGDCVGTAIVERYRN